MARKGEGGEEGEEKGEKKGSPCENRRKGSLGVSVEMSRNVKISRHSEGSGIWVVKVISFRSSY